MSFLKHWGIFFLLVLALTVIDFFYLDQPTHGIDDANIFFTYAQHIAQGKGFVFNQGGERVEGFTSLLWVLVCSVFYLFSSHPEIGLMVFLLFLTSIIVTLVYEEVKKEMEIWNDSFFKRNFLGFYALFIICIGPAFIVWSVLSLMENGLWNFIFTSIVILLLQAHRNKGFSFGNQLLIILATILLVLTRPEGFAWAACFTLLIFLLQWKYRHKLLFPISFFLVLSGASLALTYFRLHYFGYPFPNTYYAKVSSEMLYNIGSGAEYGLRFITNYHPLITMLLVTMTCVSIGYWKTAGMLNRKPPSDKTANLLQRIILITLIIWIAIFIPFSTGGDHFGGFRFYQGILLLFAWGLPVLVFLYEQVILKKIRSGVVLLGFILIIFFLLVSTGSLYNIKGTPKTQLNYEFYLATEGRETANELNAFWQVRKPTVGVVTVGGFSLNYQGMTIDLMGLNNTKMGHSKGNRTGIKNHAAFNKEVFYKLAPDIILPKLVSNEKEGRLQYADFLNRNNFDNQAMKNIFNDSLFLRNYQPVIIKKTGLGKEVFVFARNDFLDSVKQDNQVQIITAGQL